MANDVFANGREISCKSADGKTICAFPDVCWSPPSPPAGPIPIPYPNTGFAKDTANGSRTVKISGKEVMLKNKSYFKKSTGDEPATRALGMGVITHTITGKVYYNSWSMDVKFEGENVDRHLDVTTHNHMSFPGNSPPWPYTDSMKWTPENPCYEDAKKEFDACQEYQPYQKDGPDACPPEGKPETSEAANLYADRIAANKCLAARRCKLVPYEPHGCCPGQTGHHVVEASSFFNKKRGGKDSIRVANTGDYNTAKAPCICVEGTNQYHGTHGLMHTYQSTANMSCASEESLPLENGKEMPTRVITYGDAKKNGVAAVKKAFPESGCDEKCLEAQLDAYHQKHGITDETSCKSVETGYKGDEQEDKADAAVLARSARVVSQRAKGLGGK